MRRLLGIVLVAAGVVWVSANTMAAPLFTDLTGSATLAESGHYNVYTSGNLRDTSFFATEWITDSTTQAWAKYSWATPQYLGYALLGGNGSRVPDGMKVQYSVNDDGNWVDAGAVVPAGGAQLYYVPVAQTAKAARVLISRTSASYSDLRAFEMFGAATAPDGLMNTAPNMMAAASVQLLNTWEQPPGNLAAAWSDHAADGDAPRGNGDMASKPQAILSWTTDQRISGLAIANQSWWYSGGAIYAMTIEALAMGVDPALALPGDWSTVFSYSDTSAAAKLIDGRFANGTVATRALRLTITDVQDAQNNPPRAGGAITEIAVLGGVPEPGALSLLGLGALAALRRRRR